MKSILVNCQQRLFSDGEDFVRSLMLGIFGSLSVLASANAQQLLSEDFQDGNADGWAGDAGKGSIQLTEYAGNISMRLTRNASAVRVIALNGAGRVDISASFAALDLEGNDACLLEFSADGSTWVEIGRIVDGDDDGITLHRLAGVVDILLERAEAYIGVRIKANADNDTCWVDNIMVVGAPSPDSLASEFTDATFAQGQTPGQPYSTAAFTPPKVLEVPVGQFDSVLRYSGDAADHFVLHQDGFNYAPEHASLRELPPVEIAFVHDGTDLIPTVRGPRKSDHPDWEWIVEPGKIWQQADGIVRVSFPFSLQERNANCVHNGLAAFRIGADGTLSQFVYQIGSETCAYMQFDMWGAAPIELAKQAITNRQMTIDAYRHEKSARLPTNSIETLDVVEGGAFGSPQEVKPRAMTTYGYIAGGTHYVSGCPTRFGDYPFCDVLDLPSYSWAKSIVASVAAMRLEKLYPGAMLSKISDYVPACEASDWVDVTFANALDMATGHYISDVYDEDEASPAMRKFFLAETHEKKIEIACKAFPRKAAPGEKFVYRTADTYLLGVALNVFLREQRDDPDADFYDLLLVPIWKELGLSPLAMNIRRTRDDAAQPFTGWGLTLHRNDIALITQFLQNGGVINDEALLDEAMLAAALQQAPDSRGLAAVIDAQRYKNGFWAWNAGPSIGCVGDQWIPAMSGYGGLSAALTPNRATYYYVSDGGDFAWRRAAMASNVLDQFCEVTE